MTLVEEKWKPIAGYEGLYEVSDMGSVRSLDRIDSIGRARKGRILKPCERPGGHMYVRLCKSGSERDYGVHCLVLEAFTGPRPLGMEACHWNDIPGDNRPSNLRWGTRKDNTKDSVRNGTHNMSRKTHCKNGHLFDEANTYIRTDGARTCRACHRADERANRDRANEASRRYRERKKAA